MSRTLQIATALVAGLLLTLFFIYLGFPYDRLAASLATRVEVATGATISINDIDPKLFLQGPGLEARGVSVQTPESDSFTFDHIAARPAWSLSWLRGRPAFFVVALANFGEIEGVGIFREPLAFDGSARDVDLAVLPLESVLSGLALEGRADIDADIALEHDGPQGPVALTATQGTVSHPELPLAIPFDSIAGDLRFGGEHRLEIASLEIESAMGTGSVTGTVGHAPDPANAPLALDVNAAAGTAIQGALRSQGIRFGRDGELSMKVSGTANRPQVR